MKTAQEFEKAIATQVDLTKIGVYEVFVNEQDLADYWGIENLSGGEINRKMYTAVFEGRTVGLSYKRSVCVANLLDEAGVSSLDKLPS